MCEKCWGEPKEVAFKIEVEHESGHKVEVVKISMDTKPNNNDIHIHLEASQTAFIKGLMVIFMPALVEAIKQAERGLPDSTGSLPDQPATKH